MTPWLTDKSDLDPEGRRAAIALSGGAPGKAIALAQTAQEVLYPLIMYTQNLARPSAKAEHILAGNLAAQTMLRERELFWNGLIDLLHFQTIYSATQEWRGFGDPLPLQKSVGTWKHLWQEISELWRVSEGLNMEPKTALLEAFYKIRTA